MTIADFEGGAHVRVPEGKVASIVGPDRGVRLVAGPERRALGPGDEASLVLGDFEVTVASHREEPAPRRRRAAAGAWLHTALVAALHAGLLFEGSRAALASSMDSAAQMEKTADLRAYLAAAEERSATADKLTFDAHGSREEKVANGRQGNGKDGSGERHAGEMGKAGTSASRATNHRYSAEARESPGSATPADDVESARSFGMIGVLRSADVAALRPNDGLSPWGHTDPFTAMGDLLGRVAGESSGSFGLALSGTGEGGGGRGEGVGLGRIGTIGHTDGLPGQGTGGEGTQTKHAGFGVADWFGVHHFGGTHRTRPPIIRSWGDSISLQGRLPPESIRRVIHQNFGLFRGCYTEALLSNPMLAGRVTTRFVIGHDGSVSGAADGGSTLPSAKVVSCVVRAFSRLRFPRPEGGVVTVSYPIVFSTQR